MKKGSIEFLIATLIRVCSSLLFALKFLKRNRARAKKSFSDTDKITEFTMPSYTFLCKTLLCFNKMVRGAEGRLLSSCELHEYPDLLKIRGEIQSATQKLLDALAIAGIKEISIKKNNFNREKAGIDYSIISKEVCPQI